MSKFLVKHSLLAFGFMAFAVPGASAQDEDQIKDLLACDKIQKAEDKLECFNAVIEILKQQEEEKEARSSSADSNLVRRRSVDVSAARRSDFGFSAEEIERRQNANRSDKKKEPKQQVFRFTRAWQDLVGKYYFLMENGQVWKEVGGSHLIVPKRAKTIRIKRNIMGGFNAYVEGMNGRKGQVKRLR